MKSQIDIKKLAAIITERVLSVDDVSFVSISNGSLCYYVAKRRKVACNRALRSFLQGLWNNGTLRTEVQNILRENDVNTKTSTDNVDIIQRSDNSNFEKITISGDGNCLFRTLSYALYNKEDFHLDIRKNIVEYVTAHFDEFSDTLSASCVEVQYEDANHYKSVMGRDAVYGTDFEIGIFARLYKKRIWVWKLINDQYTLTAKLEAEVADGDNPINILFIGHERSGHFEYLKIVQKIQDIDQDRDIMKEDNYAINSPHRNEPMITSGSRIDDELTTRAIQSPVNDNSLSGDIYDFHEDEDTSEQIRVYKSKANDLIGEIDFESSKTVLVQRNTANSDLISNRSEDDTVYIRNRSGINLESEGAEETENRMDCKTTKRANIFTKDHGCFDILTHKIAIDDFLDLGLLRHIIHETMEKELHCSCTLSFKGWIRRNHDYWVMYANCIRRSHEASYRFDITELDFNNIRIFISSNTDLFFKHNEEEKVVCRPIRGNHRKEILKLIKYRSAQSFYLEDIQKCDRELLADGHGQNLQSLQVYHKIKSEDKCSQRKSLKSRDIADVMQSYIDDSHKEDPFIQHVALPLQVLLFTKAQLNTINPTKPLILHFDATGANINKPEFLKRGIVFYYCLLYKATKSSIPVAQMLTTQHDITSISLFLMKYKQFVRSEINKWPLANAIVTDWSWALMNSIIFQWNEMNMENYLNITYDYATKNIIPPKVTILLSCCAHTINRVKRAIKVDFPELIKIKSFIMECVVLLILCRTIDEMDIVFRAILQIILSKDENSIIWAFDLLTFRRNQNERHLKEIITETEALDEKELEVGYEFRKKYNKSKAIYANSPFYARYWRKLMIAKDSIAAKESGEENVTNQYYAPKFAHFLTIHFMPYCAIWSSIMMNLVDKNISRVSNAYVESHNRTYKEIILRGQKNNKIGDVIRALRERNEYLVGEEALNEVKCKGNIIVKDPPLYPEAASNPFEIEKWSCNRNDLNNQKIKKRRYAHMEGKHLISICRKLHDKGENKETTIKDDSQIKLKKSKNDIELLANGLVNDVLYYLLSNSKLIKISNYLANVNFTVVFIKFQLTAINFKCLASVNTWIDGEVIDSYLTCFMDEWKNVTYFPTDIGGTVLGDHWKERHHKGLKLMNITEKMQETLLLPYSFGGHWRLLIVKPKMNEITLMDPYKTTSDTKRVVEAFKKYIAQCNNESTLSEMRNKNWTITEYKTRPYQEPNDASNCALYVTHYIDCIGRHKYYDNKFNPVSFRKQVAETLIKKSEDVTLKCLQCMGDFEKKKTVLCNTCNRRIHVQCIKHNKINSEDEEEYLRYGAFRKKKKTQISTEQFTQCRLCRRYSEKTKNRKN